jgi:hypothetical protein
MKGSRSQTNLQNKQMVSHKPRPEIRDNLDARQNEEQMHKGDDATHNVKETKEENIKRKRKQ